MGPVLWRMPCARCGSGSCGPWGGADWSGVGGEWGCPALLLGNLLSRLGSHVAWPVSRAGTVEVGGGPPRACSAPGAELSLAAGALLPRVKQGGHCAWVACYCGMGQLWPVVVQPAEVLSGTACHAHDGPGRGPSLAFIQHNRYGPASALGRMRPTATKQQHLTYLQWSLMPSA